MMERFPVLMVYAAAGAILLVIYKIIDVYMQ